MRLAIRPLRKLDGDTPAREFGPAALKVVRQEMVKAGNYRAEINRRISRILRVFNADFRGPKNNQPFYSCPG